MTREDQKVDIWSVNNGHLSATHCDVIIAIWRRLGVFTKTLDDVNTCTKLCETELWSNTYKNYQLGQDADRMRRFDDDVMNRYWTTIPKSWNDVARIDVLNKDKPKHLKHLNVVVICRPRRGDVSAKNKFRRNTIATHTAKGWTSDNSLEVPEGFTAQTARATFDRMSKLGATIDEKEKFCLQQSERWIAIGQQFAEERKLLAATKDLEREVEEGKK